uniref:Uncharacterized protein n=1 Tax=Astyanax mexicanus TaxID=7994 RepID=A0A8B9GRM8_ASTMX
MLMSDVVDWLIPDIPKDISLQIHKEKILMVDLFMKEEQGKLHDLDNMVAGGEKNNFAHESSFIWQSNIGSIWDAVCSIFP